MCVAWFGMKPMGGEAVLKQALVKHLKSLPKILQKSPHLVTDVLGKTGINS
jgi:hypothetical protein